MIANTMSNFKQMKRLKMGLAYLVILSSCIQEDPKYSSTPTIVAYVPEWKENWGPKYELAKDISHINYAFANIQEGQVIEGGEKDKGDLQKLLNLKTVNPNLQILISVGGWTWSSHFSDAALTHTSRNQFSNSAIAYMLRHQIDGIDLDWEYPGLPGNGNIHRPEDKQNFTLLLELLRAKLDSVGLVNKRTYLLTIATAASQEYLDHVEMDKVQKHVDFVNLMAYDFHGGWEKFTGHHANLAKSKYDKDPLTVSAEIAINQHLKAGVPASKLVLGVPFYGRYWKGVTPKNNGLYQPARGPGGSFNYSVIEDSLIRAGYVSHWDTTAHAPFLWNSIDSIFLTYENEQSLSDKIEFIKKSNLRGIMFWQFNGDKGSLTKLISTELKAPGE